VDLTESRSRRGRIGMAVFGDLTFDSRVRREAAALARAGYDVRLVCLEGSDKAPDLPDGVEILARRPTVSGVLPGLANPYFADAGSRSSGRGRQLRWLAGYIRNLRAWGRIAVEAAGPVDAWHAHDLPALVAIAPRIRRHLPLVYDSHEIFLDAGTASRLPGPARMLLRAYERRLVRRAVALVTVSDAIARELGDRYGPQRTIAVHNCPPRWPGSGVGPDRIRSTLGIPQDAPIVLCHGSLGPGRGLEETIGAMGRLADLPAHLVFLGFGPSVECYRTMAADAGISDRFHLLGAVEPEAVLDWISTADVDVMVIPPTEMNAVFSAPNKLFESLAAGVPVVSSDFPSRRRILIDDPDGPLGTVCDPTDTAAIAAAIRTVLELDPDARTGLRARCRHAARERWNWETESAKLVALYADILAP